MNSFNENGASIFDNDVNTFTTRLMIFVKFSEKKSNLKVIKSFWTFGMILIWFWKFKVAKFIKIRKERTEYVFKLF